MKKLNLILPVLMAMLSACHTGKKIQRYPDRVTMAGTADRPDTSRSANQIRILPEPANVPIPNPKANPPAPNPPEK